MAAKKKAPRNTRWRAVSWERTYRGEAIWVDEPYAYSPKWQWTVIDEWRTGRAVSKAAAMRAAERAVDAMLDDKGGGR